MTKVSIRFCSIQRGDWLFGRRENIVEGHRGQMLNHLGAGHSLFVVNL